MRNLRVALMGCILALLALSNVAAQEDGKFVFRNNLRDTLSEKIDRSDVSGHFLGEAIAVKYYRFIDTYTYVSSTSATSRTETTQIDKPTIYYAIKKLNRYYKKQLRKDRMEASEAFNELAHALDVAYVIFNQDTEEFERALREARKPEEISKVFNNTVLE